MFEHYSQKVKNGQNEIENQYRNVELEELKQYVDSTKKLLAVCLLLKQKPNAGTEEEPQEPGPTGYVPNLMEQAKWFEKAGVGFGQ